jgi:hypothetical protein
MADGAGFWNVDDGCGVGGCSGSGCTTSTEPVA